MRLAFSEDGRYLAAACTEKSSKTVIKVFDTEHMGTMHGPAYTFYGHKNLVHDLKWFSTRINYEYYLVSSSSDFTAKVFSAVFTL